MEDEINDKEFNTGSVIFINENPQIKICEINLSIITTEEIPRENESITIKYYPDTSFSPIEFFYKQKKLICGEIQKNDLNRIIDFFKKSILVSGNISNIVSKKNNTYKIVCGIYLVLKKDTILNKNTKISTLKNKIFGTETHQIKIEEIKLRLTKEVLHDTKNEYLGEVYVYRDIPEVGTELYLKFKYSSKSKKQVIDVYFYSEQIDTLPDKLTKEISPLLNKRIEIEARVEEVIDDEYGVEIFYSLYINLAQKDELRPYTVEWWKVDTPYTENWLTSSSRSSLLLINLAINENIPEDYVYDRHLSLKDNYYKIYGKEFCRSEILKSIDFDDAIEKLKKLDIFYIDFSCSFKDTTVISGMVSLKKLIIKYNCKENLNLIPLESLKNLEFLRISINGCMDLSPLIKLKKLRTLELFVTGIENSNLIDLSLLSRFNELKNLSIYDYQITNINFIKNLKKLEKLCIRNSLLDNDSVYETIYDSNDSVAFCENLECIIYLENLRILDLTNLKFNSLIPIANLQNLEVLKISTSCDLDVSVLNKLTNLNVIKE